MSAVDASWLDRRLRAQPSRQGTNGRLALVAWRGSPGYAATATGESPLGLWACFELTRTTATHSDTGLCVLVPREQLATSASRLEAYLDGWLAAIDHVLSHAALLVLDNLIPANLVCANVLAFKRAASANDFRDALLAPRRLGRWVGDPAAALRSLDAGR